MDPIFQALNEKALQTVVDNKPQKVSNNTNFSELLNSIHPANQDQPVVDMIDNMFGSVNQGSQMKTYGAEGVEFNPSREYEVVQGPGTSGMLDFVSDLNHGYFQMDRMMEVAFSGQPVSQMDLLAGQGLISRVTLQSELTFKVIEYGIKGATGPFQMQV
ncbi:MAG: hypothetical protein HYU97_10690 [Deltaproteobacteria bacterium]|nr:hypothetical protein [Deltaproteobacteria bacterium]